VFGEHKNQKTGKTTVTQNMQKGETGKTACIQGWTNP
jgi:hypothetical protein